MTRGAGIRSNGRRGETGVHVTERRLPPRLCEFRQPVKRGEISFFPQRWNDSRSVFGFVPEPAWNVMFTTRRWTPSLSLLGLILSAISDAFFVFLTFLTTLPSSTNVTVAILLPRMRALNARDWQPVAPASFAVPGVTRIGSTIWASSTVSASSDALTHFPYWSHPVTDATLWIDVWPA